MCIKIKFTILAFAKLQNDIYKQQNTKKLYYGILAEIKSKVDFFLNHIGFVFFSLNLKSQAPFKEFCSKYFIISKALFLYFKENKCQGEKTV